MRDDEAKASSHKTEADNGETVGNKLVTILTGK